MTQPPQVRESVEAASGRLYGEKFRWQIQAWGNINREESECVTLCSR